MQRRIERLQRQGAADPAVIGLGAGLPAESTFPRHKLGQALMRALGGNSAGALQYDWPEGRERLREWIAARLRSRGADACAKDVIVTSGAQQAIAIATQVLLSPGQRIAVDAETYPAALDLF